MELDLQKLENRLEAMRPSGLDPALAERLERAVEGRLEELGPEERGLERRLAKVSPSGPSASTRAALLTILERLPFPGATKVVPFPNREKASPQRRAMPWAAAALVALAGGLSALLMGPKSTEPASGAVATTGGSEVVKADPEAFTPASFESGVAKADDLGRIWAGGDKSVRVVKVVYKDRVVWLNAQGEEMVTEVPRTEFLVVPDEID
ncbi:hypothetical protein [Haloferula sp. A504]|uniref:hypothetical protein n=1 Tax=Haloferula sp. A504 TaxID=3373601 RepID=UPI0031C5304F|nr:hypothetical protein [Verrucomicrobiaceae bacterium E54]